MVKGRKAILLLFGSVVLVGPVLLAVILILAGTQCSAHYLLLEYFSDLGARHCPSLQNYNLHNFSFIVFGALICAFAVALWNGTIKSWPSKTGVFLTDLFGVGLFLMAMFPFDMSWRGTLHFLSFLVPFGSAIPACFIFANHFRRNCHWSIYGILSLCLGGLATFFFWMLLMVWPTHDAFKGLWQIGLTTATWLWII